MNDDREARPAKIPSNLGMVGDMLRTHRTVLESYQWFLRAQREASRVHQDMLRSVTSTQNLASQVSAAIRSQPDITRDIAGIASAALRSQQQMARLVRATGVSAAVSRSFLETERIRRALGVDAMLQARQDMERVWRDMGIGAAVRAQQEAARFALEPMTAVLRAQQQFLGRVNLASFGVASKIAELSAVASHLTRLARYTPDLDLGHLVSHAVEEAATVEPREDRGTARDALFANYDGDEFRREREAVEAELEKIPGFDRLPTVAKFVQLVEIATTTASSETQSVALGVAGNLLTDILKGEYPPLWAVLLVLFVLASCQINKLRAPKTRKVLRTIPIDHRDTRIVGYRCIVTDLPKSKARRLAWLDAGIAVVITDKHRGCRQIIFLDAAGKQRVGWVRSKYLRKV